MCAPESVVTVRDLHTRVVYRIPKRATVCMELGTALIVFFEEWMSNGIMCIVPTSM